MTISVPVLCVHEKSNYYKIPGLDLYDRARDCRTFAGGYPGIHHPPCQQWSKLRMFAHNNEEEKNIALFCWELVQRDGGILEHPSGSNLFKYVGADRKKIISVDQSWFGFPARKRTYLYFNQVEALSMPISFDRPLRTVESMSSSNRSIMPLSFCQYLVNCINQSINHNYATTIQRSVHLQMCREAS